MKASDKLRANWSKRENDIMLHHPMGFGTRSDGHFLSNHFDKEFTESLKERGYDITTLKFSIEPMKGNPQFRSQREQEDNTDN